MSHSFYTMKRTRILSWFLRDGLYLLFDGSYSLRWYCISTQSAAILSDFLLTLSHLLNQLMVLQGIIQNHRIRNTEAFSFAGFMWSCLFRSQKIKSPFLTPKLPPGLLHILLIFAFFCNLHIITSSYPHEDLPPQSCLFCTYRICTFSFPTWKITVLWQYVQLILLSFMIFKVECSIGSMKQ